VTRFSAAGYEYLVAMTADAYYPPPLVAKVRAELEGLVAFLEDQPRSLDEIQARCDAITEAINGLEEEFADAESEIETVARDDIATTVIQIFEVYGIDLDVETALRNREW
jgi:hypothetical protein